MDRDSDLPFRPPDGGPPSGLVWAYRFREGLPAELLLDRDVGPAIAAEDGWLWIHLSLTDARARAWASSLPQLAPEARAIFASGEPRLGIDVADDTVYGVFSDFQRELDEDTEDVGRLRFALTERFVISGRRHALRSVEEMRQMVHAGLAVNSAGALMEAIVNRFCDAAARLAAAMTDELDSIEDHVVEDVFENERRKLVPVRRSAVRLHRQLSSLAAVFRDFERRAASHPRGSTLSPGRLAARLEALDHDLIIVQERAKLLQDEVSAKLAEETNRTLSTLSFMTAFLLPGSLVAGLFGMNVGGVPLIHTDWGFFVVLLICIASTWIFYAIIRRRSRDRG